jgi:hypothetical protein
MPVLRVCYCLQSGEVFLRSFQMQTEPFWQYLGILYNIAFTVRAEPHCAPYHSRGGVGDLA